MTLDTADTAQSSPPSAARRFLTVCAGSLALAGIVTGMQTAAAASAGFAQIPRSVPPNVGADLGHMSSSNMSVGVVLAPSNAAELSSLLADLYNQQSANYQHWLAKGEFVTRFAPSSTEVAELTNYLQASGLTVQATASPFVLRAIGPSSAIEAAFGTELHNYANAGGVSYFSNESAVQLPADLAVGVLGVVGLSNTVRLQARVKLPNHRLGPPGPSCETPYVTPEQLFAYFDDGTGFPYGYGGGPGCNGLTPSQTNSIYGAPHLGRFGQGFGVNLAVFELSAYQHSDIQTWTQNFYGPGYTPPLVDITVDGGPLSPICPAGDSCPGFANGYAGDIEVDADIEQTLSIAPAAQQLLVYNAPNDETGQTELDEYSRIANDDSADVISSSWGTCENDVPVGYVLAENLLFEQLAAQGQSLFSSSGDTGPFGCIRVDGTVVISQGDPSSQPWVTSVGGTSFESFNPDANPFPLYPPPGVETVWNVDSLCNESADEGGQSGYFWCAATGAGAGGSSQWWGRPFYQFGPGVDNPYTTYGNGTTQCALAALGTPCREVPDISANADEYTPYAEYCTGNASTPNSVCATITGTPPGWFGIGGTSLSSPLWSAIFGDRDGFWHGRIGNVNPYLYLLFNLDYDGFFHDIAGIGHPETNNNGLYPVTRGFDEATGIGTPKMGALITGVPQH
jgi:subtilase family serine protease